MSRYKKILSFVLVLMLLLSFFVIPGSAASTISYRGRVNGVNEEVLGKSWGDLEGLYSYGQAGSPKSIIARPGDEIRIPITADLFSWDNDKRPLPREAITVSDLTKSKVKVRTLTQAGTETLDYVQLDTDTFEGNPFKAPYTVRPTGRTAYISVMFAEELIDVSEHEFSYDIYLTIDGKQYDSLRIRLSGVLKNDEAYITANDDQFDLQDKIVGVAEGNSRSVKLDLGKGVTIQRKITMNRKYYGSVEILNPSDLGFEAAWPEAYPTLEAVYKLNTVNMRYGKNLVKIDPSYAQNLDDKASKVYYVYGEDMSYYGTTDDELIYSDIYFLTTKMIPTFEKDTYLGNLEGNPLSKRVTVGEFEGMDVDEAKLLAEQKHADNIKTGMKYLDEVSGGSKASVPSGTVTSVAQKTDADSGNFSSVKVAETSNTATKTNQDKSSDKSNFDILKNITTKTE